MTPGLTTDSGAHGPARLGRTGPNPTPPSPNWGGGPAVFGMMAALVTIAAIMAWGDSAGSEQVAGTVTGRHLGVGTPAQIRGADGPDSGEPARGRSGDGSPATSAVERVAENPLGTDTPSATSDDLPSATARVVAVAPMPTVMPINNKAPGESIGLMSPVDGAMISDFVPFAWQIASGSTYEVLLCQGARCVPSSGIYRGDTTFNWCPGTRLAGRPDLDGAPGVYRWQVVDRTSGRGSEVREFTWGGGDCARVVEGARDRDKAATEDRRALATPPPPPGPPAEPP